MKPISFFFALLLYAEAFASSSTFGVPVYYINVAGQTDRDNFTRMRYGDLNLTRVEAISTKIDKAELLSLNDPFTREWTEQDSRFREAVVSASHQKMIEMARNANHPMALFLEDDASPWLRDGWISHLQLILRNLASTQTKWECIRVQYMNKVDRTLLREVTKGGRRAPKYFKHRINFSLHGATAYVLNAAGMYRYLKETDNPADGKFRCVRNHCAIDYLLNRIFTDRTILPVPGLLHSRVFEGSSGGRSGEVSKLNDHFVPHARDMMRHGWVHAMVLERELRFSPNVFQTQSWELLNRSVETLEPTPWFR